VAEDEAAFFSELQKWRDRYHLGLRWVLRQVFDTLMLWTLAPAIAHLDQEKPPWHPLFHLVMRRSRPENAAGFAFSYRSPALEITPAGPTERLAPEH